MGLQPILKALEDHVSCGRFKLFSWFKDCQGRFYFVARGNSTQPPLLLAAPIYRMVSTMVLVLTPHSSQSPQSPDQSPETMMNWPSQQRTRQPIMTAAVITILLIVFPSIIILVIFSNDTKKQQPSSSSSYHQSIRRLEEDTNGPIILNEISLQKQEQEQNQQPQLSPEEQQEKHIKQYLGGLYPKVDRQFHPLYLRDTLHPREIDPKWGEVVDGDIPFFW
eukprot:scaffold133911_cov36-Cyclotella_meneghiniana.AAC.2